jgi:hypothetical protein
MFKYPPPSSRGDASYYPSRDESNPGDPAWRTVERLAEGLKRSDPTVEAEPCSGNGNYIEQIGMLAMASNVDGPEV